MDQVTSADGTPIALRAAAHGCLITKLVVYEPPLGPAWCPTPAGWIADHMPAGRHHVLSGQHDLVQPEVRVPVLKAIVDE